MATRTPVTRSVTRKKEQQQLEKHKKIQDITKERPSQEQNDGTGWTVVTSTQRGKKKANLQTPKTSKRKVYDKGVSANTRSRKQSIRLRNDEINETDKIYGRSRGRGRSSRNNDFNEFKSRKKVVKQSDKQNRQKGDGNEVQVNVKEQTLGTHLNNLDNEVNNTANSTWAGDDDTELTAKYQLRQEKERSDTNEQSEEKESETKGITMKDTEMEENETTEEETTATNNGNDTRQKKTQSEGQDTLYKTTDSTEADDTYHYQEKEEYQEKQRDDSNYVTVKMNLIKVEPNSDITNELEYPINYHKEAKPSFLSDEYSVGTNNADKCYEGEEEDQEKSDDDQEKSEKEQDESDEEKSEEEEDDSDEEDDSSKKSKESDTTKQNCNGNGKVEKVKINRSLMESFLQSSEQEDDMNTIDSSNTSKRTSRKQTSRQIPPYYVRYQLGASLQQLAVATLLNNNDNTTIDDDQTPAQQFREILVSLLKYLHTLDKKAALISWKNEKNFSILHVDQDEYPSDVVKLATFFDGYRANLKATTKHYFRFCLSSPNFSQAWLETKMIEWASLHSYLLYKCIIQAESARTIGWLAYSTSYTNTEKLKRILSAKSDFEWGFRMSAVTQTDKKVPWKNRLKALSILVPTKKAEVAESILEEVFEKKINKTMKSITDCYLYQIPEHKCKSENKAAIFVEMVNRHKFHSTFHKSAIVTSIVKNLDKKITTKQGYELTLREMILNIPSSDEMSKSIGLFRAVDFVTDSGKVWIGNQTGPGGPAIIFTYYDWLEGEALEMIKGLGVYLASQYGRPAIHKCFVYDHWKATQRWKWLKHEQRFDTPEIRHLASNILHDPMKDVITARLKAEQENNDEQTNVEGNEEEEEPQVESLMNSEQEETNTNKDREQVSKDAVKAAQKLQAHTKISKKKYDDQSLTQLERQRGMEFIRKEEDPDLDSIKHDSSQKQVHSVQVQDNQSTASSITYDTHNTVQGEDEYANDMSSLSSQSTVSFRSLKPDDFAEMIDSSMTEQEILDQYDQVVCLQVRKAQAAKHSIIKKAKQRAKQRQQSQDQRNLKEGNTKTGKESYVTRNLTVSLQADKSSNVEPNLSEEEIQETVTNENIQGEKEVAQNHEVNNNILHPTDNLSKTDKTDKMEQILNHPQSPPDCEEVGQSD